MAVTFSFGPQREPTIEEMCQRISNYIFITKGARVNVKINMADESTELLKLQHAYSFAVNFDPF